MPSSPSSPKGAYYEQLAAVRLQAAGLRLIECNYRCKVGEIDLICQAGVTWVFVEVRYRQGRNYGGAAASLTPAKLKRVRRAAQQYLQHRGINEAQALMRFDAYLFDWTEDTWLANAF